MAIPKVNLRKVKRKKDYSYMIDYSVNGVRKRECVGNIKAVALEIQKKMQADLAYGKYNIVPKSKDIVSLKQLSDSYFASKDKRVSESTIKRYKNFFEPFEDFLSNSFQNAYKDIKLLKRVHIDEFINLIALTPDKGGKNWSNNTINDFLNTVRSLFRFGINQNYLERNPVGEITKLREVQSTKIEFFSDKEITDIWKIIDPYWKDFCEFILYTGLRKGELINLKWENVQLGDDNSFITIISDQGWTTKTGKHRNIPLNKRAREIIKNQKMNQDKSIEYVFISREGYKIHPDKPYHALKQALKKLNLTGDVHKLRHTFASNFIRENGSDFFTLSKLLGHSISETTYIYAHLSPDYALKKLEKLV